MVNYILPVPNKTPRMFFSFLQPPSLVFFFLFVLVFSYSRAAADYHSGYNSAHRGWPGGQRGADVPAMHSFILKERAFF